MNKQLVVIGHMAENLCCGGGLVDGLVESGFDCYKISVDPDYPWRVAGGHKTQEEWFAAGMKHPQYDFHVFSSQKTWGGYCKSQDHAKAVFNGWEPVYVREILEHEDVYPDAILLTHSQDFIWDFRGIPSDIPVYYYFTGAVCWPRWPHNVRVRGFFYGYQDAPGTFRDMYPMQYHDLTFKSFLPNAYSAKTWYPPVPDNISNRTIDLGFMGGMDFDRGTWFSQQLYKERQQYIHHLQHEHDLDLRPSQSQATCRDFLQHVFLGANISCFGVNMRQFEVPACGALLLQYENMDSAATGLVNRENCLLFKDITQLDEQVKWALSHRDEADAIRREGVKYAQNNSFYHRGKELAEVLNKDLSLFNEMATETGTQPPNNQNLVNESG
jgi:hypothetical protein